MRELARVLSFAALVATGGCAAGGDVDANRDGAAADARGVPSPHDAATPDGDLFDGGDDVVTDGDTAVPPPDAGGRDAAVAMPGEVVGIMSGRLVRGTTNFLPRGLSLTGLALTPAAARAPNGATVYQRAQQELNANLTGLLARYASWGVNTLRYQVSQDGLDPMSRLYDATYLPLVISTVQRARDAGFVVVISMRESMPGDAPEPCGADRLPCAVTRRAWLNVLSHPARLGQDRHFVLEMYNEPMPSVLNTDANWTLWRPPHQTLLEAIRGAGATNVLIADGIRAGKFLPASASSRHRLSDPVGRLAYGIHPYPLLLPNVSYYRAADWRPAFGAFCDGSVACVATEWATGSDVSCFDARNNPDGVNSAGVATALIRFLHAANIGSIVWPGDYPGAIIADWSGALTDWGTWSTINCSDTSQRRGMGNMTRAYFVSGTPP